MGAHGQGQKEMLRGPAVNGQSGLYDDFISEDINTLTQQEGVNNELTNYRRDRKGGRGLQREGQTKKRNKQGNAGRWNYITDARKLKAKTNKQDFLLPLIVLSVKDSLINK